MKNSDSLLWKEIAKLWNAIILGERWIIGDGTIARFWIDNWGNRNDPIIHNINMSIPTNVLMHTVKDMTRIVGIGISII